MNEFARRFLNEAPAARPEADDLAQHGRERQHDVRETGQSSQKEPPSPPHRLDNYRLEKILLAATAVVWLATGAALWWRSVSASTSLDDAAPVGRVSSHEGLALRDAGPSLPAAIARQPEATADDASPRRPPERAAAGNPAPASATTENALGAPTRVEAPSETRAAASYEHAAPLAIATGPAADVPPAAPPLGETAGEVLMPEAVQSEAMSSQSATPDWASRSPEAVHVAPLREPSRESTPTSEAPLATSQAARAYAAAGRTASSGSAAGGRTRPGAASGPLRPAAAAVRPIAIVPDPQLSQLLDEAWGLIERGDHGPGRSRLLQARKLTSEDPRADFSLGLLDGMIEDDWEAAEKRFADCVRRDTTNVPSLNNLAIAQALNRHEAQAVKQWQAIIRQRSATPEVAQNLGHLRGLVKEGRLRANRSLVKTLDDVYTEAAVATLYSARPQGGFQLMPLQLSDGRSIGWNDLRKMEYTPPPPPTPATLPPGNTTPITLGRQPSAAMGASAAEVPPAMLPWRAIQPNLPNTPPGQMPIYPRNARARR